MKFYNYLNESKLLISNSKTVDIEELQKCIDDIKKNCKPFLNEWTKHKNPECLYRGLRPRNIFDIYDTKKVRKDRKPKDTFKYFHEMSDDIFKSIFGIKLRSNTAFCTGDISQAEEYGKVFAIFPIGNYKIYWSKEIKDFYTYYEETMENNTEESLEAQASENYKENVLYDYNNGCWLYDDEQYYSDDFYDAVEKVKDDYPDVSEEDIIDNIKFNPNVSEDDYVNQFIDEKMDDLEYKLRNEFEQYYEKGSLERALMSGSEIMLDCNKYYIVKRDYIPFITLYFKRVLDRPIVTNTYLNNKDIFQELK